MRKLLWIIFGMLVGGAATVVAGPYVYRHWRQEHLVHLANGFLKKGDQVNAALCLRRAVQSNPFDVRACRMYAQLAEQASSPNSVWWRHRVVDLEPDVSRNRIDWAKAALVCHDFGSAQEALKSIARAGQQTADYHKVAGALAWAQNDYAEAESQYLQASKLEPGNPTVGLNLAIVELVVDHGLRAESGRAALQSLRTNSTVRQEALRQLVEDASRNVLPWRALGFAAELESDLECRFSDRILYLDTLAQAHSLELVQHAKRIEAMAATNSVQAHDMLGWRIRHGELKTGLTWAESLPLVVRTNVPLPIIMAEGYAALHDWAALDLMLKGQNWRDLEHLRHLMKSLSLRSQGRSLEAAVEWRSALAAATKRIDFLNDLVQKTAAWHWGSELNETLWVIVENFPIEKGAFLMLYDRLVEEGNTAALHNLLARVGSYVNLPIEFRNNFAVVSLLVYPRGQHGHDLARETYEKDPQNPFLVSTYAYSLFLQKKGDEALKLLKGLKQDDLEEPSIAAYYGIILAGTGDTATARHYLERGLQARLLPEEKILLTKAERGM